MCKLLIVSIPLEGHAGFTLCLAEALSKAGHDVTMFSTKALSDRCAKRAPHVRFVGCDDPRTPEEEARIAARSFDITLPPHVAVAGVGDFFVGHERAIYPALVKHLKNEERLPDAIISEVTTMAAVDAAEAFHLPLIVVASLPLNMILNFTGNGHLTKAMHVPSESFGGPGLVMSEKMTAWQYWVTNPLMKLVGELPMRLWALPYRLRFRKEVGLPPVKSLWEVNESRVPKLMHIYGVSWLLETWRPLASNMHVVGWIGSDVSKAAPVLEEGKIKAFLDGAQAAGQAVVYMAMGTMVKLTQKQISMLAAAVCGFGPSIRVLWSLHEEAASLLPAKAFGDMKGQVMVRPWVAQPAVLAHPAVRLFVTHAGQNSVIEGLAAGKPMLAMPFGADQFVNARHVVNKGLGLELVPATCSAAQVVLFVQQILQQPSFATTAAAAGATFRQAPPGAKVAVDLVNHFLDTLTSQPPASIPDQLQEKVQSCAQDVLAM